MCFLSAYCMISRIVEIIALRERSYNNRCIHVEMYSIEMYSYENNSKSKFLYAVKKP